MVSSSLSGDKSIGEKCRGVNAPQPYFSLSLVLTRTYAVMILAVNAGLEAIFALSSRSVSSSLMHITLPAWESDLRLSNSSFETNFTVVRSPAK